MAALTSVEVDLTDGSTVRLPVTEQYLPAAIDTNAHLSRITSYDARTTKYAKLRSMASRAPARGASPPPVSLCTPSYLIAMLVPSVPGFRFLRSHDTVALTPVIRRCSGPLPAIGARLHLLQT
jgi:hypothetical protein